MAQTRKKRRSKHRGTAAGTIEARGRTGRKPTDQERKASGSVREQAGKRRAHRLDTPPTWRSAFFRALFASVLLFAFTQIGLGPSIELTAAIALCILALAIYVPLGYATDLWVYRRRQRRKETKAA